ncbi:MAG: glycosyltransferase [Epsilonproteobacteria bacterium]|nr:glycosyltransferase [Campylobacterota bacterium]
MRIVIDLQGAQGIYSRNRGIGRYSTAITKAIIRNKGSHEIFLALNNLSLDVVKEIRSEFNDLLPQENIKEWCTLQNTAGFDSTNTWRRRIAEHTREAFLTSLKPDVIYITSLFEGFNDDAVTSVGLNQSTIPVVVTLYDLIPLINKSQYLKNINMKKWYTEKIKYLKKADMLLSISESSREEALEYIDCFPNQVFNIGTAADEQFKINKISNREEKEIRTRYALIKPFLMYTGGGDVRKNLEGLIRAYALLDMSIRERHQLAIVCALGEKHQKKLLTLAKEKGLEEGELILTSYVPENDLIVLYNLCKAYIFPSWHEGFGLPALEAMRCGAAVIAADSSSLPEVIGLKEALFDARSDQKMADKILQVLTNETFRAKLRTHARLQIKKFSWDISAKKAMEAFEGLHKNHITNNRRLKLAYISPLPPEYSTVSEYSVKLLPELYKVYDIDIILEQKNVSDPWIKEHCTTRDIKWFKKHALQYHRILYHFGNAYPHKYMFHLLQKFPGIVVLHDFFLSDVLYQMSQENYHGASFRKDLYYSHGTKALCNIKNARNIYPINKSVLDHAKGIIVHSNSLVTLAEEWYGKAQTINWTIVPFSNNDMKPYIDAVESHYTYNYDEKDCLLEQLKIDNMKIREDTVETMMMAQKAELLAKKRYNTLKKSTSWRITSPLRLFSRGFRWFFSRLWAWIIFAPGSRPKRIWDTYKKWSSTNHFIKSNNAINKMMLKFRQLKNLIINLNHKQKWRIEGPFDSSYSLALLNRETALALDTLGYEVALHSTEGQGDFKPNASYLEQHPRVSQLYQHSLLLNQHQADVTSRNLYPPRVCDMHSRVNMLHHYAWEESGFPQSWVKDFNTCLTGMTCLSHHVEKLMIDNGVNIPILTSGCGVDHWEKISLDETYHIQAKAFRFLHVSSCFPRKGVDVLLKAYGNAFSAQDEVSLVIKTFPNPHNEVHKFLDEMKVNNTNFPDVIILEDDLTEEELKALYLQCHTLVGPSRAEGFGLPFAEAMLSGLAVIATGWGGQRDFCNDDTAWLIDYEFTPAKTHFELYDSVWVEPSSEHLTLLMREVYELPVDIRSKRSHQGRELLLEKFKWTNVAQRLVDSSKILPYINRRKVLNIGWISTWNTKCGIASYSEHLINAIEEEVTILAPYADSLTKTDTPNVERCWNTGDKNTLEELSLTIEKFRLETIVIQFNYGFFNFESLSEFIIDQIDQGRTVLVMLHATTDSPDTPSVKLETLVPGFKKASRLLVHSYRDLNRLKEHGLVDNAALFPHGILDYQNKSQHKNKTFTLASYGFFLPHKGLLELIESVKILVDMGMDVQLKMINAEYPVQDSSDLIIKARKRIEHLGLNKKVELIYDFLPDDECLNHLSSSDLIVFPYQETGESSSAAVRYGLASNTLVAVTPLDIFDDVDHAVFKFSGCTPENMAESIAGIIQEVKNDSKSVEEKRTDAKKWCDTHRYSQLGERLSNILLALNQNKNTVGSLK